MSFLSRLVHFKKVCIQCHNNPDADTIASAFAAWRYLTLHGVQADMVYGGSTPIKKSALLTLIDKCAIPIRHVQHLPEHDLLLFVDCQPSQGNAQPFPSHKIAIIDHHIQVVGSSEDHLIKSTYQSCSTILWELLVEEGYDFKSDPELCIALLYGLYTDTSCFADLYAEADTAMRKALFAGQPLFEQLTKANMTLAELMVASDALHNHYYDALHHFAIVEALTCDQSVLGVIGDLMIQVDIVQLSFSYTQADGGYAISLRTCGEGMYANQIAAYVCDGIGSGGGHAKKAGGYIKAETMKQKYGDIPVFDVINTLLLRYFNGQHGHTA